MDKTNPIEFELRACTKDDIPAVMDVNETTLPENYPLFFYEQILERFPESFILAYLKNQPKKIIGYIMWRVERGPSSFSLDYVKKGHLVSLAVLPEYRRMGVAHNILVKSMDLVLQYGVDEYVLEVRVSNSGAINLYHNLHRYEKIKIIERYYRDGEDAFYMSQKCDTSNNYKFGSTDMTDNEILSHYHQRDQGYLLSRCPECNRIMIKALNYALPGSINPQDDSSLKCPDCAYNMKLYDISQGKYDI